MFKSKLFTVLKPLYREANENILVVFICTRKRPTFPYVKYSKKVGLASKRLLIMSFLKTVITKHYTTSLVRREVKVREKGCKRDVARHRHVNLHELWSL